jgi:hypothetical protein
MVEEPFGGRAAVSQREHDAERALYDIGRASLATPPDQSTFWTSSNLMKDAISWDGSLLTV